MYSSNALRAQKIELGEGFIARTSDKEVLEKHELLGNGVLAFVNDLSFLVDEKKDELPEEEWGTLELTLKRLMIDYQDGELYYYLVHTHGADAINLSAWGHFSLDTVWRVCVRTFTDMPTNVIEAYGGRYWNERKGTLGSEGYKAVMKAVSKRTDIYGNGSLPSYLAQGILFDERPVDD